MVSIGAQHLLFSHYYDFMNNNPRHTFMDIQQ